MATGRVLRHAQRHGADDGVLIGALCFAEPLTLRKGAGAALGAIGVAVIARPTTGLGAAQLLPGVGACLTATACYGTAGFLTRRWINSAAASKRARRVGQPNRRHAVFMPLLSLVLRAWAGCGLGSGPAVDGNAYAGCRLHGGRVYPLFPPDR